MAEPRGPRFVSRRAFLKVLGTTIAALGVAAERIRAAGSAPFGRGRPQTVYYFDPDCSTASATCPHPSHADGAGCKACKQCRSHATNKRFTGEAVAEGRRAHACCRCTVKATTVPFDEYVRMFGVPGTRKFRNEFDARW